MLPLDPLPPAKRREFSASRAVGLSFLLHGALAAVLLAAALVLPGYLPVQSGGILTVSWAPAGTGPAANTDMADAPGRAGPPLPEPPAEATPADEKSSAVAAQEPEQAVPVRRTVQRREQIKKNEVAVTPRHKKSEKEAVAPPVKTSGQRPAKSVAKQQAAEEQGGLGTSTPGAAQAEGTPQPQVMAWNADGGPRFLRQAPLRYPRAAQRRNQEGKAVVEASLDGEGRLLRARVIQADHTDFGAAALACIQASTFAPARIDGKPVPCVVLIPMLFVLKE